MHAGEHLANRLIESAVRTLGFPISIAIDYHETLWTLSCCLELLWLSDL